MILALCGAPNCGKTTLFNRLTGQSQRTGNWPGVTVQIGEGFLSAAYASSPVRLVDLPGAASLKAFSPDEACLSQYLTVCKPDAVIVVIDSCSPSQGLYLALQLQELHLPLLLAFNMADSLHSMGGHINTFALSRDLHLPCLSVSARKSTNLQALIHTAMHMTAPSSTTKPPLDTAARWNKVDQLMNQFFFSRHLLLFILSTVSHCIRFLPGRFYLSFSLCFFISPSAHPANCFQMPFPSFLTAPPKP